MLNPNSVKFSDHAIKRMRKRKVSKTQVIEILNIGESKQQRPDVWAFTLDNISVIFNSVYNVVITCIDLSVEKIRKRFCNLEIKNPVKPKKLTCRGRRRSDYFNKKAKNFKMS